MQSSSFLSRNYLDILFANRNKRYGAYELRRNYGKRALSAIAIVLCSVLSLFLFSLNGENATINAAEPYTAPVATVDLKKFRFPDTKPVNPPSATRKAVKKYTTFVVRQDDEVKEPVPENKKLSKKQIGAVTMEGDSTDSDIATNARTKGETHETIKTVTLPAEAVRYSSVMPDFNGDLKAYLNKALKYPVIARDNEVQGRVSIEFIVNEDGTITEARVLKGIGAGCDDEALRVVKAMPRWKPGMNNGKAVKVYVILPIIFQLN